MKPTEARLRAMREAVSERGWMPRGASEHLMMRNLRDAGLVTVERFEYGRVSRIATATPAGRAWLAKNDEEGGK